MVDHRILHKKQGMYNLINVAITVSWFHSHLLDRSQIVSINGKHSEKQKILCGVPQGSNLWFLSKIKTYAADLYADDTTSFDIQTDKYLLKTSLE